MSAIDTTIGQATITCPDWCTTKADHAREHPDDALSHAWFSTPAIDGHEYKSALISGTSCWPGLGLVVELDAPGLVMTPEQARRVALGLLIVADWAETSPPPTLRRRRDRHEDKS